MPRLSFRPCCSLALFAALACASESSEGVARTPEQAAADSPAPTSATPAMVELTTADLDALERGLRREAELVRDAQRRSGTAPTPEERGRAIQEAFPEHTIPLAAQAAGVPADRYRALRETVDQVLTTLDFQGKIDGPMSVDTANAGPELRRRLTSDPFAELDASSAAALREHMDRLAPIWIEYKTLTAVGG